MVIYNYGDDLCSSGVVSLALLNSPVNLEATSDTGALRI